MLKKFLVLFLVIQLLCSNILNISLIQEVNASWIDLYQQKVSLDVSSAFSNPTDTLSVQPNQEFRFESYLKNNETSSITNVSYFTNFPSNILYSWWTRAATQVNWASTFVVPLASFNPPSIPNFINWLASLSNWSIYAVRRNILKFPSDHSIYQNVLSTYFTADWELTSNTKSTIIYVNVNPHIINYSFSKSSIVWNWIDSIDLNLKVKDYNWCWNIDWWIINVNLSSLWLSNEENLIYDSCDPDWKTANFKKIWITTLTDPGDKILSYMDFSAKDEDNNLSEPNDPNGNFDDEDIKSDLTLTIATPVAPAVTLVTSWESVVSDIFFDIFFFW